jgi:C1A family cysteine protease
MSHSYKLIYKFQKKDERDHVFQAFVSEDNISEYHTITKPKTNEVTKKITKKTPLKLTITRLGNILNQGNYGSCVANAFAYNINAQTNKTFNISRLYLYNYCRTIDFTSLDKDDGTTIRTACSAIKRYGALSENLFNYNNSNFSILPLLSIIQKSKYFKKFSYVFINQDLTTIKNYLMSYNSPIVFGFMVYNSFFDTDSNGIVAIPNTITETLEGGHCMLIVGYDDTLNNGSFICVNSWGTSWGKNGYCYIPYTYLLDSTLASDFCSTNFIY